MSLHNETKIKEQSQLMKRESISKATYAESRNVRSSLSWNCVERLTQNHALRVTLPEMTAISSAHFGLNCKLTYFSKFSSIIVCYFGGNLHMR